jgi:hypothetical protein
MPHTRRRAPSHSVPKFRCDTSYDHHIHCYVSNDTSVLHLLSQHAPFRAMLANQSTRYLALFRVIAQSGVPAQLARLIPPSAAVYLASVFQVYKHQFHLKHRHNGSHYLQGIDLLRQGPEQAQGCQGAWQA